VFCWCRLALGVVMRRCFATVVVMLGFAAGCCRVHPAPVEPAPVEMSILPRAWDEVLQTQITPPVGWKPDPLKVTDKSRHRVWISPGGTTAYGVIYFDLPLPVGTDMAFSGFLSGMKKTSGEAILISKTEDSKAVHFVADGGRYRIRCNLSASGFHGWCVYAGTLRANPVNPAELKIAEAARDKTRVGTQ
jgi:hypothetical protein